MSGVETLTLPGTPSPLMRAVLESLDPATRASVIKHIDGGTSAEWLSLILTEYGHRISATTIQRYRRTLPYVPA